MNLSQLDDTCFLEICPFFTKKTVDTRGLSQSEQTCGHDPDPSHYEVCGSAIRNFWEGPYRQRVDALLAGAGNGGVGERAVQRRGERHQVP